MGRSSRHDKLRAMLAPQWAAVNAPCGICGQRTIDYAADRHSPDALQMDHIKSRAKYPELEFEPTNMQPTHRRCNSGKGVDDAVRVLGVTSEAW